MAQVIVVGAGAAGLMAAAQAASAGVKVLLLEKMPSPGRKLLVTGKGRCNFTNQCDIGDFPRYFPNNGAFLNSAFRAFDNQSLIEFFAQSGVPAKVERGGRVFPESDKAADVLAALVRNLQNHGVEIRSRTAVHSIVTEAGKVRAVKTNTQTLAAEAIILATGGLSYPATGSTGDGYEMAKQVGHLVAPLRPSLVPLEVKEPWIRELQGLSLKNVEASVWVDDKKNDTEFGEMLFTHFGLSGPIVLSLSHAVSIALQSRKKSKVRVVVNLKPALTPEVLDKRLLRDFSAVSRKQFKNSLGDLLPAKLIPVIVQLSRIEPEKPVNQISREERRGLVELFQGISFEVTGTRPVAEAVVTAGGVSVKEINPKTMESRLVEGLFFAGEVIDVDGYTGGFNLQAAFSTGYVAGRSAATKVMEATRGQS